MTIPNLYAGDAKRLSTMRANTPSGLQARSSAQTQRFSSAPPICSLRPRSFEPHHDGSREIFSPPSATFIAAAYMGAKLSRKFFESFSRKFASYIVRGEIRNGRPERHRAAKVWPENRVDVNLAAREPPSGDKSQCKRRTIADVSSVTLSEVCSIH